MKFLYQDLSKRDAKTKTNTGTTGRKTRRAAVNQGVQQGGRGMRHTLAASSWPHKRDTKAWLLALVFVGEVCILGTFRWDAALETCDINKLGIERWRNPHQGVHRLTGAPFTRRSPADRSSAQSPRVSELR